MLRTTNPNKYIDLATGLYPSKYGTTNSWHPWIRACHFKLCGYANSTLLLYSKIFSIHYNELLERTITREEWLTGKDWNYDLYIDGTSWFDQEYCLTLIYDQKISDDPIFKNKIYKISLMISGQYFSKSNIGEHFVRPVIGQPNSSNIYIIDGLLYVANYAKRVLDIFDGRGPFVYSGVLINVPYTTFELKKKL